MKKLLWLSVACLMMAAVSCDDKINPEDPNGPGTENTTPGDSGETGTPENPGETETPENPGETETPETPETPKPKKTVMTSMTFSMGMGTGLVPINRYNVIYGAGAEPERFVTQINPNSGLFSATTGEVNSVYWADFSTVYVTKNGSAYTFKEKSDEIMTVNLKEGAVESVIVDKKTQVWTYNDRGQVLKMTISANLTALKNPYDERGCYPGLNNNYYYGSRENKSPFDYGYLMDLGNMMGGATEGSVTALLMLGWTGTPSLYIPEGVTSLGGGVGGGPLDMDLDDPAEGEGVPLNRYVIEDENSDGYIESITDSMYMGGYTICFSFEYATI